MSRSTPEHDLQVRCVTWFRYQYPCLAPLFFAVPNGGYRNKAEAARLKAEGENAGVSDLILQLPSHRYSSLNIEMKAGSSQSPAQKVYQQCVEVSGGLYAVCRSFEQFKELVTGYISQSSPDILGLLSSLRHKRQEEEVQKAREQYRKRISKTSES